MATMIIDAQGNLDMSDYPPAPILWMTAFVDTLCMPLQCQDSWRAAVGIDENEEGKSWFAHQVPSLWQHMPRYPSFAEFQQLQQQSNEHADGVSLWQSLYTFAFETSTTALGDLTSPTAALVLFVMVVLLRQIKAVLLPLFSSFGRWIGRYTHGAEWEAANEERIFKFGEYVFRLIYHSAISAYGIYYFWDKPWWQGNTLALYQGFPNHAVDPGMAWYYLLQASYNLDAMVSLLEISFTFKIQKRKSTSSNTIAFPYAFPIVWSETVRGDFREMMMHHSVTNVLVISSSLFRLTRPGSMIFMVHDISDIPVDLSKLANFLKWKWTTLSCFLAMTFIWMATRLYVLPMIIYKSMLTESHYVVQDGLPVLLYVHYRHIFYLLVGVLIVLHVAWFCMFLQIFATFLKKSECHDLSEHKQGEIESSSPTATSDPKRQQREFSQKKKRRTIN